ncbi:hypothetical protein HIM_07967 [Hirsutella minnesotensis 3608]|uniref:Aminomethyltransferase n=1 Tax=Hirsutella minnesotensis 3608 TaxID=1043627 RepID=A0A0F7ZT72_9HYPO|nr:hypothetical protein HIM_07967 [Hirsutella minnesotensis 3608]
MRGFVTAVRAAPRVIGRTHRMLPAEAAIRPSAFKAQQSRCASDVASADLKKTPLYDLHLAHGGKMVPFAGYSMPVQYDGASLAESHHFTRQHASIFDVSHMVQHIFRGPDAAAFLERVTPSAWGSMGLMQSKLTTFLWPETGGIVDDSVVTRIGEDEYYVVTNGACLDKDTSYFDRELGNFGGRVEWTRLDGSGLVALQGPQAVQVLTQVLATDTKLDALYFGSAVWAKLKLAGGAESHPVLISRGGYTGEDGFEISFNGKLYPAIDTTKAAVESLLGVAGPECLRLAGLGARDSLRLEAGMCLYGHDLDDTTTPVEAGLSWVIPQERRKAGGFHGASVIQAQLTPKSKGGQGVERRRVGFVVDGAPAREGAEVQSDGQSVGKITSGVPSPTLGKNIAMGYVKDGLHKAGTELDIVVRGRKRKGVVTKMPFITTRYHKNEALT